MLSGEDAVGASLDANGLPVVAAAYATGAGYSAREFATGFPSVSGQPWTAIGVAFDQSDNLYVADNADATSTASGWTGGGLRCDTPDRQPSR